MQYELTRIQLYEAVWAEPIQRLAARTGLSDVALAKICRRADIPTPRRGYWAKLRAGKRVNRPSLPPRPVGMRDCIEFGQCPSPLTTTPPDPVADVLNPARYAESLEEVGARIRGMVAPVQIAKSFRTVHPAIAKLLERDKQRTAKMRELPYQALWDGAIFQSRIETRRLLILNSLFLALSRFGAIPSLRGRDARELSVRIGDVCIPFKLDRLTSKQPIRCDRLRFEISLWWTTESDPVFWEDCDATFVEDNLGEIAVQILLSAELLVRHTALKEYEAAVRRRTKLLEEERITRERTDQEARERVERLRQERVSELIRNAAAWRQATDIRAYVRAVVEARASTQRERFAEWEEWCHLSA